MSDRRQIEGSRPSGPVTVDEAGAASARGERLRLSDLHVLSVRPKAVKGGTLL